MRSLSNCVLTIIFVAVLICAWSLDCPYETTKVFFRHGVEQSRLYPNFVGEEDKMAKYIKKGCQKESIESEKASRDFDCDFQENIQYSRSRSLLEHERSQVGQNSLVLTTTGGSLFVVAVVLIFCARRTEDPEETQNDERVRLTQSQSGKNENVEANDLEKGGSSFQSSSIKLDYLDNLVENGQEGPKGSSSAIPSTSTSPSQGPPPPPPPKPRPPLAPPFKGTRAPPPPPKATNQRTHSSRNSSEGIEYNSQRAKLKPFFWDKVLASSPEQSMVWDEIKAGSFQFNEEMIETLFGYNPDEKKINDRRGKQTSSSATFIQIIDSKKAQNLSILLKALNVTTEEVHDALLEGHELPPELLQTLIRMAPTSEEELKLRLFSGDISQIGPAERFLKVLVEIPFAFRRMECLLFMMTLKEEVYGLKESFATLEVASNTLRSSRLFLKILEAVLKTGNRMNDGTYRGGAQAFKLDTLLKLADVKGTDGKTTLLHFVVQEIIRTGGIKAAQAAKEIFNASNTKCDDFKQDPTFDSIENIHNLGILVVSHLTTELEVIKKAAIIDSDALTSTVAKLGQSLLKTKDFLSKDMQDLGEESRFHVVLKDFVVDSESEITWLLKEERRIMDLVKKTIDYFHGNSTREEGLRLFVIVRDFCVLLDKICAEIKKKMDQEAKTTNKDKLANTPSQDSSSSVGGVIDKKQKLFPTMSEHSVNHDSSSNNEVSSISRIFCAKVKPMKEANNVLSISQTPSIKDSLMKEDNEVSSISQTSSTKENLVKEEDDVSSISRTSSMKDDPMKEGNEVSSLSRTSFTKEKPVKEDNKVLSILRTYSIKEKLVKEKNELSLLLRTYSIKEKPMKEDNYVSLISQTTFIKEDPIEEDNEVSSRSQTSSTGGTPMKEENEVSSISYTSFTKENSIKECNEASSISRASSIKEKIIEQAFEESNKQSSTKEDLMESSSQELDPQSSTNGQQKETPFQENVIEEMRKKLFPLLQGSHLDESSNSSDDDDDDDDKLQTSTKESLSNVSSQESKGSSQESNLQTSHVNEQIKHVSTQEKVMEDMQQKLFKIIQDRQLDDSSSSSSRDDI